MPKNLFREVESQAELKEILGRHPRIPLLPGFGSEKWGEVGRNPVVRELVTPLRKWALDECSAPLPVLTDELYASFRRTGQRLEFENVYFDRRKRLGRATMALLVGGPDGPEHDQLLRSVLEKFTSIFEEESWALPAHVNWHNKDVSGKDPFQIDLFGAETANLMAEMLDLLSPLVPAPLQVRIRERLRSHIFENYANSFDAFHWTKATHNWNAVCHQGILGSALSQLDDVDLLARMLLLARQSLALFLSGFTKDGGCTEGVGYWSYGFGWFAFLNEQLETRTGGELSLVEGDQHIRKVARFGPRMSLAGGKLVNFADNGAEGTLNPALLSYLGRRLNEPDCSRQSIQNYRQLIQTGIAMETARCDVFYLARLFIDCPTKPPEQEKKPAADCFLPDLAVLVAHGTDSRGHGWDFAAKAGHNEEHHNHNDCGSFLLNIDGVRLIAEIGAPEYVHDFFNEKRYEFLAARSRGHSLPVINGCEQAAGAAFTSRVTGHVLLPGQAGLSVDATASYPREAGCRQFVRTFQFDKVAGKLRVQDVFELNRTENLEGAIIALHPIFLEEKQAIIRAEGLELVIRAASGTKLDRVETHAYQSHSGQKTLAYRLVFKPGELSVRSTLAVEMELA